MIMRKIWIPGLPEEPYRNGAYEGVVMHFTDNYHSTAQSEASYMAGNWQNAFVHEFVDPHEIIQTANPNYIAYGAGAKANQRFVHLELCVAHSQSEFDRSFDMWCQRAAVYLSERQLGVIRAAKGGTGTLWGHFEVTAFLGGTDHLDPLRYLRGWGLAWEDVVDRVQQHYDALTKEEEYMLTVDDAEKMIGLLGKVWEMLPEQGSKDEIHRLANELRKASGQEVK